MPPKTRTTPPMKQPVTAPLPVHPGTSNHSSHVTTPKPFHWSFIPNHPQPTDTDGRPFTIREPAPKHTTPEPHYRTIKPIILPPDTVRPTKPSKNTKDAPQPQPKSVPEDYDVCKDADCSHPQPRPLMESGATVYVVLGVKSFLWDNTDVGHVMSDNKVWFISSSSSFINKVN